MLLTIDDDAFGHAQIKSKLMLIETLNQIFWGWEGRVNIDFYASWYGIAPFLMATRNDIQLNRVRCFDIDPEATEVAKRLCRSALIGGMDFRITQADVNDVFPTDTDVVINTSVEHMELDQWFANIPSGTIVGLQGTDMIHPNEVVPNSIRSLEELEEKYPLNQLSMLNDEQSRRKLEFAYDGQEPFTRFQIFGRKI